MSVVAIDLAARFSAGIWLSESATTLFQWDSWQISQATFLDQINILFDRDAEPMPWQLVVEDLPPRLPFMTVVKDVCRLQGRIGDRMDAAGRLDRVLFVQPAQWRAHFPGLENGTGPTAVVDVAARLGYTPPDLSQHTGKGVKAIARKVATDYCAAFLIGRWALDTYHNEGTFDVARTSRYHKV